MIWLETYAKTHLFYIILIVGGVVSFRVWLSEHDSRIAAENNVRQAEVNIVTLQKQIDSIPAQTATKVQVVTRVVHDAVTPSQVVAAVPQLTEIPLATRAIPGNQVDVEVAAQPLMQLIGELKTSQIELGGCQQVNALKDQQIVQLQVEVKAAKPKFLQRVKQNVVAFAVGVAVGAFLHH